MARAEEREALEQKRLEKRQQKRAKKRETQNTDMSDLDALGIARGELNRLHGEQHESLGHEEIDFRIEQENEDTAENEVDESQKSGLMECLRWLFKGESAPPKEWKTYRREEIQNYISSKREIFIGRIFSEGLYYKSVQRKKIRYWGDYDGKGRRDGRGICWWPDPPLGGGESYYGLWREDQPNGHGVFRWFSGDIYMGEWQAGKEQGYGVYEYGEHGSFRGDVYEGTYFAGLRQGIGVYKYSARGEKPGGVYMGEWMRGYMHGKGVLTYEDGEFYIGTWKVDHKDGIGVYSWGRLAGENAGDKFEGKFTKGLANGHGRTIFNDGSKHQVLCAHRLPSSHAQGQGEYSDGELHGWGILRASDGWEFVGKWVRNELDGEVVRMNSFGFQAQKIVQIYSKGKLIGTREYDKLGDWEKIESQAHENAKDGEAYAKLARNIFATVTATAKKARNTQILAQDAAEEAIYWLREAKKFRNYIRQWFGIRKYIWPIDA